MLHSLPSQTGMGEIAPFSQVSCKTQMLFFSKQQYVVKKLQRENNFRVCFFPCSLLWETQRGTIRANPYTKMEEKIWEWQVKKKKKKKEESKHLRVTGEKKVLCSEKYIRSDRNKPYLEKGKKKQQKQQQQKTIRIYIYVKFLLCQST